MGMKMSTEEIEKLVAECETRGDGMIYLDEMAERLCPPKVWDGAPEDIYLAYKLDFQFHLYQKNYLFTFLIHL